MKICRACHEMLPEKSFRKVYKLLKSGEKRHYYNNHCRMCQYEADKPTKYKYYLANKHLIDNTKVVAKWRAKNRKQGRCSNCTQKLQHKARLCLPCYIEYWISTTVNNIKKNRIMTLPIQDLKHRAKILRNNRMVLAGLLGSQGYPNNRLRHIVPVRVSPQVALLATNIQWVRYKPRNELKVKECKDKLETDNTSQAA